MATATAKWASNSGIICPARLAQFYFTLFYNLNMPYLIYDRCRKPPASGLNFDPPHFIKFSLGQREKRHSDKVKNRSPV